jgi:tetratricopeptide (TPR) repeat protein
MHTWSAFPYADAKFNYKGAALKKAWKELHRGDCEPFPQEEALREAWRSFHRGDFQQAVRAAEDIGLAAHAVANKATGIYATYLEENSRWRIDCFKSAIERAERAIEAFPEDPNAHYFHAFNLGRYSQTISVVKALRQGVGGKILGSLQRAIALQPAHAEAHTALGMYHAEIIDKVGKFIGGMTYGASESKALEHFREGLRLTPRAPIARIEYGNGLYLLYGESRLDEVSELYEQAAETEPLDAMEQLDVESALAEME